MGRQGTCEIPHAPTGTQGNGLGLFPLINQSLATQKLLDWMMSPSEKVALIFLLEHLRPKVAIEIGTKYGGSLQVLAQLCDRVCSIDVDLIYHAILKKNCQMLSI